MAEASNFIKIIKDKFGDTPPSVILDIGSRDLDQSIEFITAFPNTRVIAFEPNPDMIGVCKEKQKGYPAIELYEYAISDEDAIIDFYSVKGNVGASSTLKPSDNFIAGVTGWNKVSGIQAKRLDTLLPELGVDKVEVVWMDVQGVELKALKGMGKFFDDVKLLHTEASQRGYYEGHILKDELEEWIHQRDFDTEFVGNWQQHSHGEADLICIKKGF
jgi:FkbM family methyltransferase